MQKLLLSIIITANLLLVVACQPRSAAETSLETVNTQSVDQDNAAQKPLVVSETKVADNLVDAQTCLDINKNMQKVDDTSKIVAIYKVQEQLKACLPTANNAEVMTLLKSYQDMYNRFLTSNFDSESDNETFNNAIYGLFYGEGLSSAQLKTLSPRDQYLVELVKSKADVSIYDEGEGYFSFTHNLKAMADIFTPYLRKDQRLFIQRMAIDNQESFWSDASVTVPFKGLIERALFWEDYIRQYPDGYSVKDAQYLLDFYRYIIFFGAENTQWTDDAIHEFMTPEDEQLIQRLSKHPSSLFLAKDAQKFLKFLALSDDERQQEYSAPSTDKDGNELSSLSTARYQLDKALQIPSIWNEIDTKDCFQGLFCTDENTE